MRIIREATFYFNHFFIFGVAGRGFKKEYRMQVNAGLSAGWRKGAAMFARLTAEETGGMIRIKPYYGSLLLKGVQLNATQMVAVAAIACAFEATDAIPIEYIAIAAIPLPGKKGFIRAITSGSIPTGAG